ncbi:uncharacterized protein LOC130730419 isoform X2 [Lotus japonicus]|nr:uncharacterized protein LOC130730419 isoform X2 [Lotus japonicus]
MTGETDSKRRAPGVVARLMGLDGPPLQLTKEHKGSSENHLKRTEQVGKTGSSAELYDGGSSRRSSKDQMECKDVYEVSEIAKVESGRFSSQPKRSADLKSTDAEMSFSDNKFMDAKRLATYQDLQYSQDSHDALGILDSDNGLLHEYSKRPDSLFKKHLDNQQASPLQSNSGPREAKKLSAIENFELCDFSWKSDREMIGLNYNSSREKHHDGFTCGFDRRHAMHSLPKSSKLQFKGIDEPVAAPTRIVILKPNLGKVQRATKIVSTPRSSDAFQSQWEKRAEFPDVRFRDIEMSQKKSLGSTARHSRNKSLEYRKVAKEITSQIKNNLDNGSMVFSSSRLRGYTWDDSSCDFSGIESPEKSDVTTATLGNPSDKSNTPRPSPRCSESSVSREAKKRLSERWKMSQQGRSICRSSTLAEMLAVPDKETKAAIVDSISNGKSFHDKLASNGKPAGWVEPVGISSRDGWKDGFIDSLPRSKSLPASSTPFGSPRTFLRHEALRDDRHMTPIKWERKKVVKCLDHRQCVNTRRSKSGHKKSWPSYSSNIEGDASSSPDISSIHNKVKINLEEDLPKQEVLAIESFAEIRRDTSAVTFNVVDVTNENAAGLSESSDKELSVGSSSRNSAPFQPPVPRLESSSSKVTNHPSPVSVLGSSLTHDLSSPGSECFGSLSDDLKGLRMQIQLLKSESGDNVEGSAHVSNDEDGGESSTGILEDKGLHNSEDSWESSYVIDVLSEAGIDIAQPEEAFLEVWRSLECSLSLSVFDELEMRYSDWTICSMSERRLLFDRINSALVDIHDQFMSGSVQPWVSPGATSLCFKLNGTGLLDCLYSILGGQGKSKDIPLDNALLDSQLLWFKLTDDIEDAIAREIEKVLFVSHLQWFNLRDAIEEIVKETESLLLDDLVAEIAST